MAKFSDLPSGWEGKSKFKIFNILKKIYLIPSVQTKYHVVKNNQYWLKPKGIMMTPIFITKAYYVLLLINYELLCQVYLEYIIIN